MILTLEIARGTLKSRVRSIFCASCEDTYSGLSKDRVPRLTAVSTVLDRQLLNAKILTYRTDTACTGPGTKLPTNVGAAPMKMSDRMNPMMAWKMIRVYTRDRRNGREFVE